MSFGIYSDCHKQRNVDHLPLMPHFLVPRIEEHEGETPELTRAELLQLIIEKGRNTRDFSRADLKSAKFLSDPFYAMRRYSLNIHLCNSQLQRPLRPVASLKTLRVELNSSGLRHIKLPEPRLHHFRLEPIRVALPLLASG